MVQTENVRSTGYYNGPSGLTVEGNFFQGGVQGSINLKGHGHVVQKNVASATTDNAITVSGHRTTITGNTIISNNDAAISYRGESVSITDNTILYSDDGILSNNTGDNASITGNYFKGVSGQPIMLRCFQGGCSDGYTTIFGNLIIGGYNDADGISVSGGNRFIVERNDIRFNNGRAINFSGNDSTIRENIMSRCGSETVFQSTLTITGDSNQIEANEIYYSSFSGIEQRSGSNKIYRDNTVEGSGRSGIQIQNGINTIIEQNIIQDCSGEGLALVDEVDSITVTGNTFSENDIADICWNADIYVGPGLQSTNTFYSGAGVFSTPCKAVTDLNLSL